MRLARLFSTALSRSKQALYEPYTPRLTKGKVKALRKVMKRKDPRLHYHIPTDLYSPSYAAIKARSFTVQCLETLINANYGPQYTVIDISLGQYATDINVTPLELAISDTSRPDGFLPGTEGQPLTGPYDHQELARLLQKEGFIGEFIDGDAITMIRPQDRDIRVMEVEDIGPLPFCPPWPNFTPFSTEYITYPPVLSARHVNGATLPFNLSPPIATHLPLRNLIREYLWDDLYKDLVSIIYLWARSVNLGQMTPACIALMVIGYIQVRHNTPSLQNPCNTEAFKRLTDIYRGSWIRGEFPFHPPKAFWVETAFLPAVLRHESPPPYKKIKQLLYGFFEFWAANTGANIMFIPSQQYVSVREGTILDRDPTTNPLRALQTIQESQENIKTGVAPWSPLTHPTSWRSQPIVVQDPFIPSYNHARNMTTAASRYFHYVSSVARRTMFHGHPLRSIVGHNINPEPFKRGYSTKTLTIEANMLYEALLPSPPVLQARKDTIDRVNRVLQKEYGSTFHVEAFGSTRYGVSTAKSDLDLILLDHSRRTGFSKAARNLHFSEAYNVVKVGKVLSRSGFVDVFPIPTARVPIVKFVDRKNSMECDLIINERLGLVNTLFIGTYCDLSPDLVRQMSLLVKMWARARHLNDPSGQYGPPTLSSYALNLMIIGYLQVRGVLPSLHMGLEKLKRNAMVGNFWVRVKGKRVGDPCDIRYKVPENWQPAFQLELGEALLGFFRFWGDEFDYEHKLLSVRHGAMYDRPLSPRVKKEKKKKKNAAKSIAPPSTMDLYDETRADAEDVALAAWKDEVEGLHEIDESADIGGVAESEAMGEPTAHRDETNIYHITVQGTDHAEASMSDNTAEQGERQAIQPSESDTPLHDESDVYDITAKKTHNNASQNGTAEQVKLVIQASGTGIPATADVGPPAEKRTTSFQAVVGSFSHNFSQHVMILPDPFVIERNLATLSGPQINYFRAECRNSVGLIELGESIKKVINPGGTDMYDDDEAPAHEGFEDLSYLDLPKSKPASKNKKSVGKGKKNKSRRRSKDQNEKTEKKNKDQQQSSAN
ncbi:hypothetical protein BU17DRAFT_80749 [Hysterangium stoloniferum]|nr:hypothetical protein BU17DRAFT_80749 [Hysterangium stoloniferum]